VAFELQGETRQGAGRSASRKLRTLGRVPAIIYGGGQDPLSISLEHNVLLHQMEREAFSTSILTIKLGAETQSVVVKEVQRHPAKPHVVHLDFQRVVEDEEITLSVPVHFTGEAAAKGVKEQGGVVEHIMTDVEISCLPRFLPEFLVLDVTELGLNEILHLSDLKLPEGVSSVALEHGQDHALVAINPPRREEAEEEAAAPAGDAAVQPAGDAPAAEGSKD
jgi:large subunit ribosomal protein L25